VSAASSADPGGREALDGPAALYTTPFIAVLVITFLVFAQNFAIQPVIPLLVLEHGGDAALVGVVFAVFSIPSVILRPWIGRLADRFGARRVLLAGTLGLGLAGPAYLLGSLPVILANRIMHGTAWAAVNTGGPSLMARLAPPARRGEAAGVFDLMPGIAQLAMPSVGLLVYASAGTSGVFAMAAVLGVIAAAVLLVAIPTSLPAGRPARSSASRSLLEPAAVLPMAFQLMFTSVVSLFLVYPPILAAEHGIPLADLAIYYPIYGATLVVSRALVGRVIDRLPRTALIASGAVVAIVALLLASTATTLPMLIVAGALYAAAAGFSSPAMMAVVIDRTPADRLGSAMATYTLGFQFGSGIGAAVWGFVIAQSGFAPAFLIGAGIQVALLLVLVRSGARLARPVAESGA
jgi:MFS family permease